MSRLHFIKNIINHDSRDRERCTEIGSEVHVTEPRTRETSLSRLSSLAINNYYFSIYEIVSIYKQLQIDTRKKNTVRYGTRKVESVREEETVNGSQEREESGSSRFFFFLLPVECRGQRVSFCFS